MKSPINFLGKCLTVLVGAALSWATVTNPDVDRIAANLCGCDDTANVAEVGPIAESTSIAADPVALAVEFATEQRATETQETRFANSPVSRFANSPIATTNLQAGSPPDTTPSKLAQTKVDNAALRSSALLSGNRVAPPKSPDVRIQEISTQLKQLGASYLLLEKLPQSEGVQYRVRCDLARDSQTVKCCFESTRETPLDAMEDILQAVRTRSTPSSENAWSI